VLSQVRGGMGAATAAGTVSDLPGIGQRVVSDLSQDVDGLSRTWTDEVAQRTLAKLSALHTRVRRPAAAGIAGRGRRVVGAGKLGGRSGCVGEVGRSQVHALPEDRRDVSVRHLAAVVGDRGPYVLNVSLDARSARLGRALQFRVGRFELPLESADCRSQLASVTTAHRDRLPNSRTTTSGSGDILPGHPKASPIRYHLPVRQTPPVWPGRGWLVARDRLARGQRREGTQPATRCCVATGSGVGTCWIMTRLPKR